MMAEQKTEVVCHLCNYEWMTRSTKKKVSCPNCCNKTNNPGWEKMGDSDKRRTTVDDKMISDEENDKSTTNIINH